MRTIITYGTALLLAAALAACGGGGGLADKSADEILDATRAAIDAQDAVRVSGEFGELSIDVRLVRGEGGSGSISQGANATGVLSVDGVVYTKANVAGYTRSGVPRDLAELISDRWYPFVYDDASEQERRQFDQVARLTDMDSFFGFLFEEAGAFEKGEVREVDGVETVELRSGDDSLWIATEGDPLPLRTTEKDGDGTFTQWNEPVELRRPDDVVDVEQFKALAGGIATMDADRIVATARRAALAARSLRVIAKMPNGKITMRLNRDGDGRGRLAPERMPVDLIVADGSYYMKRDADSFRAAGADAATTQALAGRWLKVPPGVLETQGLGFFGDKRELISGLLHPRWEYAKAGFAELDGRTVIRIAAGDSFILIAAEGRPYPLKTFSENGGPDIVIDRWDEPLDVSVPAGAIDDPSIDWSRAEPGARG